MLLRNIKLLSVGNSVAVKLTTKTIWGQKFSILSSASTPPKTWPVTTATKATFRSSAYDTGEPDLLQRTRLPMHHFQSSLPRLPLPDLNSTLNLYLETMRGQFPASELVETERLVEEFRTNAGPQLHAKLSDFNANNKHTSYINKLWTNLYLSDRRPVALTHNPALVLAPYCDTSTPPQDIAATNALWSALRFLRSVQQGVLEPDVFHLRPERSDTELYRSLLRLVPRPIAFYASALFKAFPLDMSQLDHLFFSTRIPEVSGMDRLYKPGARADGVASPRHVLVLHRGHMYTFDVFESASSSSTSSSSGGSPRAVSPTQLLSNIRHILEQPNNTTHGERGGVGGKWGGELGALTTMRRDEWAAVRARLCAASARGVGNAEETLEMIDGAAFCLVLDSQPITEQYAQEAGQAGGDRDSEEARIRLSLNMLHGPAHTRWFDKSFSLLVSKHGHLALNFEHSWGDGVAVMRFVNELWQDLRNAPAFPAASHDHGGVASSLPPPAVRRLELRLPEDSAEAELLRNSIDRATREYDAKRSQLELNACQLGGGGAFTKSALKRLRLSPDAMMQLCMQMAYYRLHGGTRPGDVASSEGGQVPITYESCSTSAFRHGRTETIRSATSATRDFCRLVFDDAIAAATALKAASLQEALSRCSREHMKLITAGYQGKGWDRHLFALRHFAEADLMTQQQQRQEEGGALPGIFNDQNYARINEIGLSTSTLSSDAVGGGCFAAVTQHGYGAGYVIRDDLSGILVTNWKNSGFSDSKKFCEIFADCAEILSNIIHEKR